MGPMHDKHAELSKLVQAHVAPLYEELVALSVKIGMPLPETQFAIRRLVGSLCMVKAKNTVISEAPNFVVDSCACDCHSSTFD
jgi:hypothetical protein